MVLHGFTPSYITIGFEEMVNPMMMSKKTLKSFDPGSSSKGASSTERLQLCEQRPFVDPTHIWIFHDISLFIPQHSNRGGKNEYSNAL